MEDQQLIEDQHSTRSYICYGPLEDIWIWRCIQEDRTKIITAIMKLQASRSRFISLDYDM